MPRRRSDNDPLYRYDDDVRLPDVWQKATPPNSFPQDYQQKLIQCYQHAIYDCHVIVENDEYGHHVYLTDATEGKIHEVISDRITTDEVKDDPDVVDRYGEYAAINLAQWWMAVNQDPSSYLP